MFDLKQAIDRIAELEDLNEERLRELQRVHEQLESVKSSSAGDEAVRSSSLSVTFHIDDFILVYVASWYFVFVMSVASYMRCTNAFILT